MSDPYEFAHFLAVRYDAGTIVGFGYDAARRLAPYSAFDRVVVDTGAYLELGRRDFPEARWIDADPETIGAHNLDEATLRRAIVICAGLVDRLADPARLLGLLSRLSRAAHAVIVTAPEHDDAGGFEQLLRRHGLAPTFLGSTAEDSTVPQRRTAVAVIDRCPVEAGLQPPDRFRPLALVTTYNDRDIAGDVVARLLDDGIDVLVQDNWSTDGTFAELQVLAAARPALSVERFPPEGPSEHFDLRAICRSKEQIAARHPGRWIIHHDSDEIRCSPWAGISLRGGLYIAELMGFTAIDFTIYDFRPVDDRFPSGLPLDRHFKFFEFCRVPGNASQVKIWRQRDEPIDLAGTGGHEAKFAGRRLFPYKFLLKHYPLRSPEHARRKIFEERKRRFSPRELDLGWHHQYAGFKPDERFLWDASGLIDFSAAGIRESLLLESIAGIGIDPNRHDGDEPPRRLALAPKAGRNGSKPASAKPASPPSRPGAADGAARDPLLPSKFGPPAQGGYEGRRLGPAGSNQAQTMTQPSAFYAASGIADFISPASFWAPTYRHYSAWLEHAPFAYWLMDAHRPAMLVELGVGRGFAFSTFCQSVELLGLGSKCFGIDPWAGGDSADGRDDSDVAMVCGVEPRHAAFATLLKTSPDAADALFADGAIDLLHFNSRFFGDDPQLQFDRWRPKLSDRAVVLFDGADATTRKFGDNRFWLDLVEKYPHFTFPHGSGLALVAVGPAVDPRLKALCAAELDNRRGDEIRDAYARLGAGLGDRFWRLNQRDLAAAKDETLDRRGNELAGLRDELEAARERVTELRSALGASAAEKRRLSENLDHFVGYARRLETELKARDEQDAAYRGQIDHLAQYVAGLEEEVRARRDAAERERTEREEARLERAELERKANAHAERAAAESARAAELEERLAALQRSIGWRLTRPLRWLGNRFPASAQLVRRRLERR
jgi:hypothetical protein